MQGQFEVNVAADFDPAKFYMFSENCVNRVKIVFFLH